MCSIPVPKLSIKRLNKTSKLPTKGTRYAAGYDLFSDVDIIVAPKSRQLIKTGISMKIPSTHFGKIYPRSSVANKFTDIGAGVIDSDYRGEVMVMFFNFSDTEYKINSGDRIAQLILHRLDDFSVSEVEDLDETERGSGGFGSTGK